MRGWGGKGVIKVGLREVQVKGGAVALQVQAAGSPGQHLVTRLAVKPPKGIVSNKQVLELFLVSVLLKLEFKNILEVKIFGAAQQIFNF